MKKSLFLILLSFFLIPLHGQIAVESFRLLENDLTAITAGTQETDQNGEVAALIKVVTTQQGFTFDGGMLGIVKVVQQPAEIWVYVPRKLQRISIAHPDLGMLRDYYFQIPVDGGRTYELVLTTGEVITTVKKARTTQYLTIRVTPPNAILYVDDALQPLSVDGTFFQLMPLGRHSYRVQAAGYKGTAGVVELTAKEKGEVKVELQSLQGTLTINCADKEADIVVSEEVKGRGNWTGELFPGMYVVEARHEGHRTVTEEVTLGELEKKTVILVAPTPIFGFLRVESEPMGATVYVDGKRYDETPCVLDESAGLLVGSHEVKLTLKDYADYTDTIIIKEGEETTLDGVRLKKGAANEPSTATIKDNHEYVDLGLPSGLLWATCNVGANSPEEYGDYFAWGETEQKNYYGWGSYKWCNGSETALTKYNTQSEYGMVDNKFVLELSDDAANVNWGGSWRMPTEAEWTELRTECRWKWTTLKRVRGLKVTSKSNGNSIFLPCARIHSGTSLTGKGEGVYMSSSLNGKEPSRAWNLGFTFGLDHIGDYRYYSERYRGISVRPVCQP